MLCIYNIYKYQQQQQQKNWKLESSTGEMRGRICSLYNFNVPISGLKFKKMFFFYIIKSAEIFFLIIICILKCVSKKLGFLMKHNIRSSKLFEILKY